MEKWIIGAVEIKKMERRKMIEEEGGGDGGDR